MEWLHAPVDQLSSTCYIPPSSHFSGGFAFFAKRGSNHVVVLVLWLWSTESSQRISTKDLRQQRNCCWSRSSQHKNVPRQRNVFCNMRLCRRRVTGFISKHLIQWFAFSCHIIVFMVRWPFQRGEKNPSECETWQTCLSSNVLNNWGV